MHKIFIDGQAGTTGLQISERLAAHADIHVLQADPATRKDPVARAELLASADEPFSACQTTRPGSLWT